MFENIDSMIAFIEENTLLFIVVTLWSLAWKGFALWKAAARKKNPYWFVAILVLNTYGIIDILYIFIFSEWKKITKKEEPKEHKEV